MNLRQIQSRAVKATYKSGICLVLAMNACGDDNDKGSECDPATERCGVLFGSKSNGGAPGDGTNSDAGRSGDGRGLSGLFGRLGPGEGDNGEDGSAGGDENVGGAPGSEIVTTPSGSFGEAVNLFYTRLCDCADMDIDTCTETTAEERACESAALDGAGSEDAAWTSCAIEVLDRARSCVEERTCSSELRSCFGDNLDDPFSADCGQPSTTLQQTVAACYDQGTTDGPSVDDADDGQVDCQEGTDDCWVCLDGTGAIPYSWVCDFEFDCPDGSDEDGC